MNYGCGADFIQYPLLTRNLDNTYIRHKNMKRKVILSILVALFIYGCATKNTNVRQPVRNELADMVEQVVAETRISINISAMTDTSVNINEVNGKNVCSQEAKEDVIKLQKAFDSHPNIYLNIGPYIVSSTDHEGKKVYGDLQKLRADGIVPECTNVYVSIHE